MRMSRALRLSVAGVALFGLLGAAGGVATAMPVVPQPPPAGAPAVSPHAISDPPYDKVHALWGPDVSSWQHPAGGGINWAAVRGAGASFAFVKASEGTGYTSPYYRSDTASARAQGLYVGGYHFARPRLPFSTAATEANYFANIIGNVRGRGWLPPVLDLEVTGGLSPANLTAWTRSFLQTVQARTGRVPIVYTGWGFWLGYMNDASGFAGYPLWDAAYNNFSSPGTLFGGWTRSTFWQYTWHRAVPGIIGNADASYFHGSRAQLAALANDAPAPPRLIGPSPAPWAGPARVAPGGRLLPGQQVVSPNHEYRLVLQGDGNLVIYGPSGALWAAHTNGPSRVAVMQTDGNLVVYGSGRALWASGTRSRGTGLELRNDGNLIVVAPGYRPAWMTGTRSASMLTGTRLVGNYNQFLTSPNGLNRLIMQADGNLVLYNGGRALWATGTLGANRVLLMRTDGYATVYRGNDAVWFTPTGGHPGSALAVTNDGNVIVRGPDGRILWARK